MNIHFVIPQLVPIYGMEKAAVLLLDALAKAGVDVSATLISGSIPDVLANVDVESLEIPKRATRLGEAVPKLRRRVRQLPLDTCLVASGAWSSLSVGLALLGTKRRYVAWEHSALKPRMAVDRRLRFMFQSSHLPLLRPEAVVAVSDGVSHVVSRRSRSIPVEVIPNIIEQKAEIVRTRPRTGEKVSICTVGALRPLKNYLAAVQCMAHLPASYVLHMAGDGVQRGEIERAVDNLGLNGRVRLHGHVSDVESFLRGSDILLHPSKAETFGFGLVEAAELGKPVVVTPAPTMDEMVPHLVPGVVAGYDSKSMAHAIETIVMNRYPDQDVVDRAAAARAAKFNPSTVAEQWVDFLTHRSGATGTADP